MPAVDEKGLMTCAAAARVLGLSEHAVWRLAAVDKVCAVEMLGRPIRFDRQSVERLAAAVNGQKPPAGRRTARPPGA
jgi:hypothetical protein